MVTIVEIVIREGEAVAWMVDVATYMDIRMVLPLWMCMCSSISNLNVAGDSNLHGLLMWVLIVSGTGLSVNGLSGFHPVKHPSRVYPLQISLSVYAIPISSAAVDHDSERPSQWAAR